ncbi:MAG: anti-sigma factor family protein [Alphaproteobacteria bacterium]
MNDKHRFSQNDLSAYLDGELDDAQTARVEQWLATDATAAATLAAYREQQAMVQGHFDPVLDEVVPAVMSATLAQATARSSWHGWRQVAAAILLFAAGGAGGWGGSVWYGQSQNGAPEPALALQTAPLAGNALSAHAVYVSEVLHPVEVAANQQKHLLAWLSKRVGTPLRAPDMSGLGFDLVGGRLLPDAGKAAAQLMYENQTGQRLTLYIRQVAQSASTAFRFVSGEGYSAFYWLDAPLGYALVADLPRQRLLAAATQIYEQLNR